MAERAADRLLRLVGIIAYLDRRGKVDAEALAEHFDVTPAQILADVELLWVSGTPGYWPDDLIDFDVDLFEQGVVSVVSDRGLSRVLRLGTREAIVLLSALQGIRELLDHGLSRAAADILDGVLAKLSLATGAAAEALDVQVPVDGAEPVRAAVGEALATGRRLRVRYVNASDVQSERDLDPYRLFIDRARTYLQGWCYRAGGDRTFRLDRVLDATVLDEPAVHTGSDTDPHVPVPDLHDELVTLELDSSARWIAEQVPVEGVEEVPGGGFRVSLRIMDFSWLRTLLLRDAQVVWAVDPPDAAEGAARAAQETLEAYTALDL